MAGMDERRKDEGGIVVVGCFVVGLLFAVVLLLAVVWVRLRSSIAVDYEQQATIAVEAAQEAQVSASEEQKPIPPQETPEPEVK